MEAELVPRHRSALHAPSHSYRGQQNKLTAHSSDHSWHHDNCPHMRHGWCVPSVKVTSKDWDERTGCRLRDTHCSVTDWGSGNVSGADAHRPLLVTGLWWTEDSSVLCMLMTLRWPVCERDKLGYLDVGVSCRCRCYGNVCRRKRREARQPELKRRGRLTRRRPTWCVLHKHMLSVHSLNKVDKH